MHPPVKTSNSKAKKNPTPARLFPQVHIDATLIADWASFHQVFSQTFGFSSLYVPTLDTWLLYMSAIDDLNNPCTTFKIPDDSVLVLVLDHAEHLKARAMAQYVALIECLSWINWQRLNQGQKPLFSLAFKP